jgi:hypothetical protein
VVAVVGGLVFLMSGGKKEKPLVETVYEPPPTPEPSEPAKTKEPEKPPYPKVEPRLIEQARAVAKKAADPAARAKRVYDEAMEAKRKGNDDLWQAKLAEADEILTPLQDEWNEIIQQMPSTKDYDEEEVANHYVGKEGREIQKALALLPGIKKSLRLK